MRTEKPFLKSQINTQPEGHGWAEAVTVRFRKSDLAGGVIQTEYLSGDLASNLDGGSGEPRRLYTRYLHETYSGW